jgi:hypothetical protein
MTARSSPGRDLRISWPVWLPPCWVSALSGVCHQTETAYLHIVPLWARVGEGGLRLRCLPVLHTPGRPQEVPPAACITKSASRTPDSFSMHWHQPPQPPYSSSCRMGGSDKGKKKAGPSWLRQRDSHSPAGGWLVGRPRSGAQRRPGASIARSVSSLHSSASRLLLPASCLQQLAEKVGHKAQWPRVR